MVYVVRNETTEGTDRRHTSVRAPLGVECSRRGFVPAAGAEVVAAALFGGEFGGGGQAEREELLFVGQLIPGLHSGQKAFGTDLVYVKLFHTHHSSLLTHHFPAGEFKYNILTVLDESLSVPHGHCLRMSGDRCGWKKPLR